MTLKDNLFDLNLNQIPKTPELLSGAVSYFIPRTEAAAAAADDDDGRPPTLALFLAGIAIEFDWVSLQMLSGWLPPSYSCWLVLAVCTEKLRNVKHGSVTHWRAHECRDMK